MSQENVEIMRNLLPDPDVDITLILRDDDLWAVASQTFGAVVHPDFETAVATPGIGSTYVGVDGFRQGWLDWVAPWESYCVEIEELIDSGDRVVALMRDRARRHGVDAEVELVGANVTTFRNKKIARIEFFPSRAEALEAVGLRD